MSRAADRARGERAVFPLFAQAAGLPVREKSIRSRLVPEPDIRCTVNGEGALAFELGEVVNPPLAEMTHQSDVLRRRFAEAYAALPATKRVRIESSLGGRPAVFVAFSTPPGKWPQAILPILDLLVERAEQLVHGQEIRVWQIASLKGLALEMEVQRASSGRAGLYAVEMTEVVDRTLALLQKKFKRR